MRGEALKVSLICLLIIPGLLAPAIAEDKPYYPFGGGIVHGTILGFNFYKELIPLIWAKVSAYQDGKLVYWASSMAGGYYELILPVGWYTLTVEHPGFETWKMTIFVSSGSSSSINPRLKLSREPVYKPEDKPPPPPAQYTLQIAVSGLPPGLKTQFYVDGTLRDEMADGETAELTFELGTSHDVSVSERLERNGERYIVDEPSITVSKAAIHEFEYEAEYLLRFATEPEGLSLPSKPKAGWYPAETTVSTPEAPTLIEGPIGVRYRFEAWTLDGQKLEGNPLEFRMNGPHTLKVTYSKEYLVEVSSDYGTPEGSGWYPEGSTATISIQPSEGFMVKQVFLEWSGDYTGKEATAKLTVNEPMRIVAVWTIDYTPLIILIVLVTVGLVAASATVILSRRKPSAPTGQS